MTITALILSVVLVLAGCAKGHDAKAASDKASASAAATKIANSPSGKKMKVIIASCEKQHSTDPLSKATRNCIVPPGHGRAFLDCLVTAGIHGKLSTKQEGENFAENQLVVCAVSNR